MRKWTPKMPENGSTHLQKMSDNNKYMKYVVQKMKLLEDTFQVTAIMLSAFGKEQIIEIADRLYTLGR